MGTRPPRSSGPVLMLVLLTVWLSNLLDIAVASGKSLSHPPLPGWSPEVAATLEKLLTRKAREGGPSPVAVLDCDDTLIDGDVSYAFLDWLAASETGPEARERRLRDLYVGFLTLWTGGREADACAWLAGLLSGRTPAEAADVARASLDRALSIPRCQRRLPGRSGAPDLELESGIRFRPALESLLRLLQQAGWEVWLVSASAQPLVEAVAARHGIPPERVLGVRPIVREGRLTTEVAVPVTWRQGKVDAIRAAIGRRAALALGDAWTDYEMLLDAEVGVLLDRGKADLREALRGKGILVQPRFEGPGSLPPCLP